MAMCTLTSPWTLLQPREWAALPPEVLPCIVQTYWLPFTSCTFLSATPVPLSPFSLPLLLRDIHTGYSLAWTCLLWTLPDTPASDCALPHSYSNLSPPPHVGVVMFFPFLSFFTFRHRTMYITRSNCCQERKRIHSGNRIWEVSQKDRLCNPRVKDEAKISGV